MFQPQLIDLPPVASPYPVWRPFTRAQERELAKHVHEVRRCFDWPGTPYHELADVPEKFNRWVWHNLPLLVAMHHSPRFISRVSSLAGQPLKPSYCYLSMYGKDGVCPSHLDREQCAWTVDYVVSSDAKEAAWPLHVGDASVPLTPGEAVLYSGTRDKHWRDPMPEASDATFYNLAFFHFVPVSYFGPLQ